MGLAYANSSFSLLANVLTKIAYQGGRVVMCIPAWGCSGEHAHWRRMLDRMTVGRVQLPEGPIYVPEDSDTAMQAPEWARFLSIVDGYLNPVPLCDLDQVLLKEVMAENCGLTLLDLKNRSPEHLSATLTGCESPDGYLEPAAVKEDAHDQLPEIASTIPPVDPSCVELKHSAFLAQLLLEEVDLESTSDPTSPVGKPLLNMQPMHSGEPVAQSPDALARPASNNMPLSEHDTQELRRLLYLKAEGIERQERLQYLTQTWKSSIWSEEDDYSYTLPDPEIPLVYSLHYGQQYSPERDDCSVPAETADRQNKKEHGKSNLHAEEDLLQKVESLNLDPHAQFLSVYFFSIDPQKFIDGSTSSPGCSVINETPGLFKFWADPVKPWITIKSPIAAIWSRGKRNNVAVNFLCLAQSRNRERRPLPSFATPFSWQCRKLGSRNVPQRTRRKANS